jgi:hypothetical protein
MHQQHHSKQVSADELFDSTDSFIFFEPNPRKLVSDHHQSSLCIMWHHSHPNVLSFNNNRRMCIHRWMHYLTFTVFLVISQAAPNKLAPNNHLSPNKNSDVQQQIDVQPLPNPVMSRSSFFAATATAMMASSSAAQAVSETNHHPSTEDVSSIQLTASSPATSLQESVSGFTAGAALGAVKTLVKFPLDTATVRLQMPNSDYSVGDLGRLFNGSYNGLTLSLLSNIPAGAIFFAFKDAAKASLRDSALSEAPKWLTTSIAVGVAQVPYWLVRNPGEVIKVRQQAGIEGYGDGVSATEAFQKTFQNNNDTTWGGIQEFYTGYWENIVYAYPADVIKFVGYEALTNGRRNLSPLEGAGAGALATACKLQASTLSIMTCYCSIFDSLS